MVCYDCFETVAGISVNKLYLNRIDGSTLERYIAAERSGVLKRVMVLFIPG